MVQLQSLLGVFPLVAAAAAAVVPRQLATTSNIYQWTAANIEGIGVRSNGLLLATRMDVPEIWQVDPTAKTANKILTLPDVTALAGIVEMAPDVWYVVGGKLNGTVATPESWAIFKIDLSGTTPTATVFKQIKEAKLLNGLAKFNDDTLFIGDAQAGTVYKMSTATGEYSVLMSDPTMVPQADIPFGLDGVRYYKGFLYFTNITRKTFNKIAIDAAGKLGQVENIFSGTYGDDMSFDGNGNAYIATNRDNSVIKVDPTGKITQVAAIERPTSTAFGRTDATKNILYVGGVNAITSFTVPA